MTCIAWGRGWRSDESACEGKIAKRERTDAFAYEQQTGARNLDDNDYTFLEREKHNGGEDSQTELGCSHMPFCFVGIPKQRNQVFFHKQCATATTT